MNLVNIIEKGKTVGGSKWYIENVLAFVTCACSFGEDCFRQLDVTSAIGWLFKVWQQAST
jgi:hypothetical protein